MTAHRALCTSCPFTEPGLACRRSGLGGLYDPRVPWDSPAPGSFWPALPRGRSAAREARTCLKPGETQAKSPRPERNLLKIQLLVCPVLRRWAACPSVFLWASAGTGTDEAPPGPRPAPPPGDTTQLSVQLQPPGWAPNARPLCVELKRHQGALWAASPPAPAAGTWSQASAPRVPRFREPRCRPRAPCFRGRLWTAGDRTPGADTAHSLRHPRRLCESRS